MLESDQLIDDLQPAQYLPNETGYVVDHLVNKSESMQEYNNGLIFSYTPMEKQVEYMLVDLRSLVRQRKILKMIGAVDKFKQYPDKNDQGKYRLYFNRKEFAKTLKGLMLQAEWAKADEIELSMVMNMIKAQYSDKSSKQVQVDTWLFYICHLLPSIGQMLIFNESHSSEDWRIT